MADRFREFVDNAQEWAEGAAERASELTRDAAARAIEIAQSGAEQAADHLQEWADRGAEHHNARADERAELSAAARRRALPHALRGIFDKESAEKAKDLHSAADEHDAATLGHALAAFALGAASKGLRHLRGPKADTPAELPEADQQQE